MIINEVAMGYEVKLIFYTHFMFSNCNMNFVNGHYKHLNSCCVGTNLGLMDHVILCPNMTWIANVMYCRKIVVVTIANNFEHNC